MHYYKRDIGKYYKKAGRLTMLQHGAYTMLMDACYDRETFPTIEQAIDWCWASTNEEIDAVKFVLSKFFTDHDGTFKQAHITETLDKYHTNAAINKAIALEREAKRRTKSTKREPVVDEPPPNKELGIKNQELRTTNQELGTKDQKTKDSPFVVPDRIDADTWKSFVEHRQKLKAAMTDRAKVLMINKLNKLTGNPNDILNQSIENGWKGVFEIKQENNNGTHQQNNKPSLAERATEARRKFEQQDNNKPMGANDTYLRS